MPNKMSNKDKERLLQIIEYLKINESIKKSEGDYKTTVYKLNF